MNAMIGVGIFSCLILIFVLWISWKWVCKRLININKQLHEVIDTIEAGRGDLTKRVQCFCTDEIGTLAAGINIFIETLHKIMGQINVSSSQLGSIVATVSDKVETANSNSVDISAVMEELEQCRVFKSVPVSVVCHFLGLPIEDELAITVDV